MLDKTVTQEIQIDRGVPMPPSFSGRPEIYPWGVMNVGDSFLFPASTAIAAASSVASSASKRYRRKFRCRTTPEGVRCWRIA